MEGLLLGLESAGLDHVRNVILDSRVVTSLLKQHLLAIGSTRFVAKCTWREN